MANIFLETHTQNAVDKLFPDPFPKIKNEHIYGSISSFTVCFYYMQVEDYRNVMRLSCRPLAYT